MPIVRTGRKLIYFAHVPKCAGTAVERYLGDRFGPLAFLDRGYLNQPLRRRWNKTSPQHIAADAMQRLFPEGFFDESFTVVRNPYDRLQSVFRYQRDIEKAVDADASLSDWLSVLRDEGAKKPFYLDNHARPMADFVPDSARVFRLEDGTAPIIRWLDEVTGEKGQPRRIGNRNTYEQRLSVGSLQRGPEVRLTKEDRRLIGQLYAVDFERFGYAEE